MSYADEKQGNINRAEAKIRRARSPVTKAAWMIVSGKYQFQSPQAIAQRMRDEGLLR